jgi:hypothetical protein
MSRTARKTNPQPLAQKDIVDSPYLFTSILGGVLVATPYHPESRQKNRKAVVLRITDQDLAWFYYNAHVTFVLFDEDERHCRFRCNGKYSLASCRIIRDCDDLPKEIAKVSAELWAK